MSPDTLLKISLHLKRKNINPNIIQSLIRYLGFYKKEQIIYPGVIRRHLIVSMHKVYELLEEIESTKIISRNFEVHCNNCPRYKGTFYASLNDVSNNLICESCQRELDLFNNILIVYQVVME
ncbi:hypothetical protein [Bacillus cereus]|uniref:hypothetical protein n=1 Tax=Bacillus cereus TaxID=1396 RepID=UPI0010683565|nr:hypothetical protein [Bacillus cereus]TEX16546.1 hypothetical protein E2F98_07585 [Bacillus cereus]